MTERAFYDILIIVMYLLAAVSFASLFFIRAPYGRYARPGWGKAISARTGWIVQELPSVVLFAVFYFLGELSLQAVPLLLFTIWQIHYVQRTFIFPFFLKGNKKNAALATVALAFLFTSLNGYLNGRWLSHFGVIYDVSYFYDPRFIAGVLLFFTGFLINLHSDHILRNLRKGGETGYGIPQGGLFRYVSAANYFGEIIEWTGWAIATWSPAGLCFAVWTFANLAPRAISHHKWYKENFPDYPKKRKAVIPFFL